MGRPKKEINYELAEKLFNIHCTQEEVAFVLNVGLATLKRDEKFRAIYKKGGSTGKVTLRRLQWAKAQGQPATYLRDEATGELVRDGKGNPVISTPAMVPDTTMQIWLGKQILGQADKIEQKVERTTDGLSAVEFSDEELVAIIKSGGGPGTAKPPISPQSLN